MILLNPTDDRMQWAVGVHAPYVNGSEEAYFPPQQFAFEPGEPTEVPDAAVEVLLEHLGPRGLVRCGLQDDREARRAEGRRAWFDWLEAQVRRHQVLNEEQSRNGRPSIRPNREVRKHALTYERLKQSEFTDAVLDVKIRDGHVTDQVQLSDDPLLAAAAARARDREAMFAEPEPQPQA